MPPPNHERLSDRDLVSRANAGDGEAFGALYERYREWIVAVAHRLSGDREVALDALQDVMRYWLTKFARPDVPFVLTGDVKSFLYPAIRNVVIDAARRQRRERSGLEALASRPGREPDSSRSPDAGGALARALAALPEGQREVLFLHYADGLPLAAIAEALGVPLGTVKSRLGLGLQALRKDPRLGDGGSAGPP
ncbi:MAG: sigma-70 family RNA polymerase sigma factor [Phycisphaerae bacterium]|nr:sigma-70 family RNA polymerase sigma factor [Phycisphaerae bacterium]